MDARFLSHPTDRTLRAYGLGKLDDDSAELVHKHLERCPACRNRVAELSTDSFLQRIRHTQKPSANSTGGASLAGRTQSDNVMNSRPSPSATSLPPGLAEHPDYEIKCELGRGGMGVVYLAHHRLLGRDEVLKVIGQHIVELPGAMDRFSREIRAVARLRHTNIVSAYTAFRCGTQPRFRHGVCAGLTWSGSSRQRADARQPRLHYVHEAALRFSTHMRKGWSIAILNRAT